MKKTLLSLSILFSVAASAQLTQANHAFAAGDKYSTVPSNTTGIVPGAGGAGATWNYSTMTVNASPIVSYTAATSSNAAYNPANIAVSGGANNTSYYLSSASDLKYYGGDITAAGAVVNVKYSNPAIVALYPMGLNTTTTSITSGTAAVTTPFPISGAFSGTCHVIADGTGTLILPLKTFTNTIRVVTSQTIIAASLSTTVNLVVYDYYSTDASKAPILTINTSTLNSSFGGQSEQTAITVQKDYEVVGINESTKASIQLSVFPNPASSVINFSTESMEAVKVIAYDVTGKVVATEALEMGKAKMNLNNLSAGAYMYHVTDKNNQVLKAGKFNVAK
ncbi:MAG: T9SS type A sorting domain-containing protein [Bacteroidota bacterium]